MRKEISIAVIIGIVLGGIVLYGIKIANDTTNNLASPTPTPSISMEKMDNEQDKEAELIVITSHHDGQVVTESEIKIEGKSLPNSNVAIIWEGDDVLTKTDINGKFFQDINLILGENTIKISVASPNQELITKEIKIYYTNKEIN